MGRNVFNVWPKRTLFLPVWPRDTKRLDIPFRSRDTAHGESVRFGDCITYSRPSLRAPVWTA